jgi:hypothetical protein
MPMSKVLPEGGLQVVVAPQLSLAVGNGKLTAWGAAAAMVRAGAVVVNAALLRAGC